VSKMNVFFILCLVFSPFNSVFALSEEEAALLQESAQDSGIVDSVLGSIKKIPIPDEIKEFIAGISFEEEDMFLVEFLDDAIGISGFVIMDKKKIPVEAIKADEGNSFTFWLPKKKKLSDILLGLEFVDKLPITKPAFIISTFEYHDERYGVMIKRGLNVISTLPTKKVSVPDALKAVKKKFAKKIPTMTLHGVVPKKAKKAYFVASAPIADTKLSEVMDLDGLGLPSSTRKVFDHIVLSKAQFFARFSRAAQRSGLTGKITLYNTEVDAIFASEKVKKEKVKISFKATLPPKWKFSDGFSDLKYLDGITLHNGIFLLSNYSYKEPKRDVPIEPGLNIVGNVTFSTFKSDAPLAEVATMLGKSVKDLTFAGVIKKKVKESVFKAYMPLHKKKVSLQTLIDLRRYGVPDSFLPKMQGMVLKNLQVSMGIGPEAKQVEASGDVEFNKKKIQADILFKKIKGKKTVVTLILNLPPNWRISDDFPLLKPFDEFTTSNPKIVLSTEDYDEEKLKAALSKGLNFVSKIDMSGPLEEMKTFITHLLEQQGITSEKLDDIVLVGALRKNILKSDFSAEIPIRITFDFEKLQKKKPKHIKKLTTEPFTLAIKADASFGLKTGVSLYLTSQEEPITLVGEIAAGVNEFGLSAAMIGTLDPAFGVNWLALGNFGIELDVDYKVLAATGLPSGFGLRGTMDLGQDKDKVSLDIAGKVELSATTGGEFIFSGKANKIPLSSFVGLLVKMVDKNVSMKKVPGLSFSDVELTVVPVPATIAGKSYESGVIVKGGVEVLGVKGGVDFKISAQELKIHGGAHLSKIDTPVFKITGKGPDREAGTKDDGPAMFLDISPEEQRVYISGMVEFPPLKISKEAEIDITPTGGSFKISEKLFGKFETEVAVSFDVENPQEFNAKFVFNNDLLSFLTKDVVKEIKKFEKKNVEEVEKLSARPVEEGGAEEVARVENRIAELKEDIEKYKRECDEASLLKKIYECPESGAKITGAGIELASLEAYKEAILKPGVEVVKGLTTATREVGKAGVIVTSRIAQWTAMGLGDFLNVTKVEGEFSGESLLAGKTPKLTLEGVLFGKHISLKDMYFDFNNPEHLFETLAQGIIQLAQ